VTDEPAPEIPEARIVDRESAYDKAARTFGLPMAAAVFTMWSELLSCLLLSALIAEVDGQRFEVFDIAMGLAFGVLAYLLARRIVRPSKLDTTIRRSSKIYYPSTSWAHALFDLLYAALGLLLVIDGGKYKPGPDVDAQLCLGLGLTILPGALFVLRMVFWRRQREINGR
jgi:hypothetical protein